MMNENVIQEDLFDYAIKGELIVASLTVGDSEFARFNNDIDYLNNVKVRLAHMIAKTLLEDSKFVEFTRLTDHSSLTTKFIGRMAVVPKDQVQIIRQLKKS